MPEPAYEFVLYECPICKVCALPEYWHAAGRTFHVCEKCQTAAAKRLAKGRPRPTAWTFDGKKVRALKPGQPLRDALDLRGAIALDLATQVWG